MAELTARIYGESLLDVSEELGVTNDIQKELAELKVVFEENPSLYAFYDSPKIGRDEKKAAIKNIFDGKLSETVINFLCVLIDKKRTSECLQIIKMFDSLVNEKNGVVAGVARVAKPISDKTAEALEKKLCAVTGKNIKLKVIVDPSVIGGVRLKVGDSVIDTSVATQLKEMKSNIDNILI